MQKLDNGSLGGYFGTDGLATEFGEILGGESTKLNLSHGAAPMRYYLNFTIAGLSLIGGVVACVSALVAGTNWELVVLAAVFFSFSTGNLTLLEIRDAVRAAAERERIKDETLGDAEPIVLRVGPTPYEDDAPLLPRQAQM